MKKLIFVLLFLIIGSISFGQSQRIHAVTMANSSIDTLTLNIGMWDILGMFISYDSVISATVYFDTRPDTASTCRWNLATYTDTINNTTPAGGTKQIILRTPLAVNLPWAAGDWMRIRFSKAGSANGGATKKSYWYITGRYVGH